MKMTLVKMPNMEPEEAASVARQDSPNGRMGHQPTYKTLDPKLVLSKKYVVTKMEQRLKEWLTPSQF